MEDKKTALVTGANKGIGFEVCRQLADSGFEVILTSRDVKKGEEAIEKLKKEGLDLQYHQLDVTSKESVENLRSFIEKKFGKLDVLINNAGILISDSDEEKDEEAAILKTFETNTLGPLRMCRSFLPLMIKNNYGRIVNVSSGSGQLSTMSKGGSAYKISKTALNAVTRIISSEAEDYNIKVNSVCPGWVQTDMGGYNASRTPKIGAETITWLAMLPNDGPTGKFFRDKKEIDW